MKKIIILGVAFMLLTGLSILACVNGDDVGKNNLINTQIDNNGDFILTISVAKTALQRGENFVVDVQFKNKSDKDVEIAYYYSPFDPQIPNWELPYWYFPPLTPDPDILKIESNGYYCESWNIGGYADWESEEFIPADADEWILKPGNHELKFRIILTINHGTESQQKIEVWSNTIKLTVK